MADVTKISSGIAGEFGYYLEYLENRFSELEENAADWSALSSEEKNEFLSEWSIVEDRIRILSDLVARHGVPPAFSERYTRLLQRVSHGRLLLASLWAR